MLTNKSTYRALLLNGELRYIYRLPKEEAAERLDAWLAWASRSKLKPFIKLARTTRKHKAGVLAAIQLGISNCFELCAPPSTRRPKGIVSAQRRLIHGVRKRKYGFLVVRDPRRRHRTSQGRV